MLLLGKCGKISALILLHQTPKPNAAVGKQLLGNQTGRKLLVFRGLELMAGYEHITYYITLHITLHKTSTLF